MTHDAHKRLARAHQQAKGVSYARALRDVARRRLAVPLGTTDQGRRVHLDLTPVPAGAAGVHALVLGDSNRTILTRLADGFARLPDVEVWLMSGAQDGSSPVRSIPVDDWAAEVEGLLGWRTQACRAAGAADSDAAALPDVVVAVDVDEGESPAWLPRLARQGRSLGIHMILAADCTETLPPGIEETMGTTIRVTRPAAVITTARRGDVTVALPPQRESK